jgi:transposase
MLPTHVLLPLKHMALDTVEVGEEHIIVHDHSTQQAAGCPVCHTPSTRPHSWYTRTLADAPCVRRVVTLVLRVRRFFCDVAHCPRKIFVERWSPMVLPYARRTTQLVEMFQAIAAGGHGGTRLAATLHMPTSMRTLLRLMHAHVLPPVPAPRVAA